MILRLANIEATRAMHGLDINAGPKRAKVVVWTDDVDAAYNRLLASGAPPLSPPHDFLGRLRAARVADPDRGPVQIVAELPVPRSRQL